MLSLERAQRSSPELSLVVIVHSNTEMLTLALPLLCVSCLYYDFEEAPNSVIVWEPCIITVVVVQFHK